MREPSNLHILLFKQIYYEHILNHHNIIFNLIYGVWKINLNRNSYICFKFWDILWERMWEHTNFIRIRKWIDVINNSKYTLSKQWTIVQHNNKSYFHTTLNHTSTQHIYHIVCCNQDRLKFTSSVCYSVSIMN